jgi:hypothetical protein
MRLSPRRIDNVERYRFATIKTDKDDYAPGQQRNHHRHRMAAG